MKAYQDQTREGFNDEIGFSLSYILIGMIFNIIGFIMTLFNIFQSCGPIREKIGGFVIAILYWPFYWILKANYNLCTI